MNEQELIKNVGNVIPEGVYSERDISLCFYMFKKGYKYATDKAIPWIKDGCEVDFIKAMEDEAPAENEAVKPKIYAILHRGYEFDDMGYPNLVPTKFFASKEKRDKAFEELVAKQLQWFEKCKADDLKYYSSVHNEDEYCINVNDGSTLELFMGNWCYEWATEEYDIELE